MNYQIKNCHSVGLSYLALNLLKNSDDKYFFILSRVVFIEKLMTYSGLVSGYMWSTKVKKKYNLSFFLKQKILFKFFKWII